VQEKIGEAAARSVEPLEPVGEPFGPVREVGVDPAGPPSSPIDGNRVDRGATLIPGTQLDQPLDDLEAPSSGVDADPHVPVRHVDEPPGTLDRASIARPRSDSAAGHRLPCLAVGKDGSPGQDLDAAGVESGAVSKSDRTAAGVVPPKNSSNTQAVRTGCPGVGGSVHLVMREEQGRAGRDDPSAATLRVSTAAAGAAGRHPCTMASVLHGSSCPRSVAAGAGLGSVRIGLR
jgi:hypothetical protein